MKTKEAGKWALGLTVAGVVGYVAISAFIDSQGPSIDCKQGKASYQDVGKLNKDHKTLAVKVGAGNGDLRAVIAGGFQDGVFARPGMELASSAVTSGDVPKTDAVLENPAATTGFRAGRVATAATASAILTEGGYSIHVVLTPPTATAIEPTGVSEYGVQMACVAPKTSK